MDRDWRKYLLTWIISSNEELFWLTFCQNVEFIRLKMVFVIVELAYDTEIKNWLEISTSHHNILSDHFEFNVFLFLKLFWSQGGYLKFPCHRHGAQKAIFWPKVLCVPTIFWLPSNFLIPPPSSSHRKAPAWPYHLTQIHKANSS